MVEQKLQQKAEHISLIQVKETVKITKRLFFNEKIQEITLRIKRPWNLMN